MSKRLLLNSASALVLYAVNIVIAFIMSPIIVKALGNRDYGIWEILLSFCGYFGILELGLGPAIIRYVARDMALENWEGLKQVFNSAFWGFLILGILSFAAMSLVAIKPEAIFNMKPGEVESLSLLCVIAGLNMLVQFIGTLFVAFLMGRQEHFFLNLFRCLFYSIQAIFIFLALTRWEGSKLIFIAGITLAGNIFQYAIICAVVFYFEKILSLRWSGVSYATLSELYRFGVKSAILMVSDRIQKLSLPLIITHILGPESVVFFIIPKRLFDYVNSFVISIGTPLMPYFSALDAKRIANIQLFEWFLMSKALAFICLPLSATMFFLAKPFINIWLGPEYAEKGYGVIIFLSISFLITSFFLNSGRVLLASNRHGEPAKKQLVVSILSLIVSIPLTRFLDVSGSGLALMVSDVTIVYITWKSVSKYLCINTSNHIKRVVTPISVPFIVFSVSLFFGGKLLLLNNYLNIILIFCISYILYVFVGIYTIFDKEYRRSILKNAFIYALKLKKV